MLKFKYLIFFVLMVVIKSHASLSVGSANNPISIQADSIELQSSENQGIFTGHVILKQDSSTIKASRILAKTNNHKEIIFAKINGSAFKQAHFFTLIKEHNNQPLNAYADVILYYPLKDIIILQGNATVKIEDKILKAPKITYNTKSETIITQKTTNKSKQTVLIFRNEKLL